MLRGYLDTNMKTLTSQDYRFFFVVEVRWSFDDGIYVIALKY